MTVLIYIQCEVATSNGICLKLITFKELTDITAAVLFDVYYTYIILITSLIVD